MWTKFTSPTGIDNNIIESGATGYEYKVANKNNESNATVTSTK